MPECQSIDARLLMLELRGKAPVWSYVVSSDQYVLHRPNGEKVFPTLDDLVSACEHDDA